MVKSIESPISHWERFELWATHHQTCDRRGDITRDRDTVWLIPARNQYLEPTPPMLIQVDYFHGFVPNNFEDAYIMFVDTEDRDWPSHWIVKFTPRSWLYSRLHFALVSMWVRWRMKRQWKCLYEYKLLRNIKIPWECWEEITKWLAYPQLQDDMNPEVLHLGLDHWRRKLKPDRQINIQLQE